MSDPTSVEVDETYEIGDQNHKVKESCGSNGGRWICVTHPTERFQNQLQKDSHISRGTHVLGWICFQHGLERP